MPMPSYPVICQTTDCPQSAEYKIAAQWSDGLRGELKTYALCCRECLLKWFTESLAKQKACRLAKRETLAPPGIYRLRSGQRDQQLPRMSELEHEMQDGVNRIADC